MGTRAAIYCRISDDKAGQGLGIARQLEDCRALAATHDWEVVAAFTQDNDVSAYSGKVRPGYRDLLDGIRHGAYDVIVAWHPDRLHRSPRELEEFIALVESHGVAVHTVTTGDWDLSTASGLLNARILGSLARYESQHRSERILRTMRQNAQRGKSHGRISYGWTRTDDGREVVDDAQAAVVREIAARILAGDSLTGIVKDFLARDVPTPTARPWTKSTIRGLVLRERNVGLLIRHGEVVGDGDWDPILDRGTWDQVVAVLSDPKRRTSVNSQAVHLLSGIAVCGICGDTLRAATNGTVPIYRCFPGGHVGRKRADVDAHVVRTIVTRLARPDAAAWLAPDRSDDVERAVAEAARLRAKLDLVADQYVADKMDLRQFERMTAQLRPQLADAEARARIVDDMPLLDGLLGADDVAAEWEALPLSRRRAIVDLLVEVRVLPTRKGAQHFDRTAVPITWKTGR